MAILHIAQHAKWQRKHPKQAAPARNAYDTEVYMTRRPQAFLIKMEPQRSRSYKAGRALRRALTWRTA